MSKYNIACIADLHFRAFPPKDLYFELQEGFIKKLDEMDKLDLIVILGDLYNAETGLNNIDTVYSFKFGNDIKRIALEKNAKVRLIKGTRSHDQDQLYAFAQLFQDSGVDFKLITEVQDEQLFQDVRVLYIPEEYMALCFKEVPLKKIQYVQNLSGELFYAYEDIQKYYMTYYKA